MKRFIPKDQIITKLDLDVKRPGTGISPKFFNDLLGKKIKRDLDIDNILQWDDMEN